MFPKTKKFGVYALFLLIAILLLSGFFVFTTSAGPDDLPVHIHLTWQNDTGTTITVTWQTSTNTSGDVVKYDNESRSGNPILYRYNATGINYNYTGASGYVHDVELTGLTPDTVYYFICGGDTGGWSSERAFRTAPSVSSDVRFVAGGDSRTNVAEREKISQAMAEFNPAFVMHSGDMVYDGRVQSQWDSWFSDVDSHWIGENNLTIPIIPAIGNHENNAVNYYKQFALPDNEMWYSYDWGPDIHIICLSTETTTSGAQKDWLENDLATHTDYTWKIVMFHQPPIPGSRTTGHSGARTDWVPLFDKYHVDIVINGHDHIYLRTMPINLTASQSQAQSYENGTMYIISGGWGAPLYTPGEHWYDAYVERPSIYHFCLMDIFKNGSMHLQAKDNQGNTFDEVWIIKNYSLPLPEMSINLTGPTGYTYLPVELKWNSTGLIDHYKIYVDGQFKKYLASVIKSYTLTGLTDGDHAVVVAAYDPLGRSVNDSVTFTILHKTIDGDPSDWTGTPPATNNTWIYDAAAKEWIWADEMDDDTGNGSYMYPTSPAFTGGDADLTEFRVMWTPNYVYFLLTFDNIADNGRIDAAGWLSDPIQAETTAIAICIDTDNVDGSGYDLVDDGTGDISADIRLNSTAYWEYLIEICLADIVLWHWNGTSVLEAASNFPTAANVTVYETIEFAVPISPTGEKGLPDPTNQTWSFFAFVGLINYDYHFMEVTSALGGSDSEMDPDAYDAAFFDTRAEQEAAFSNFTDEDYATISAYKQIPEFPLPFGFALIAIVVLVASFKLRKKLYL